MSGPEEFVLGRRHLKSAVHLVLIQSDSFRIQNRALPEQCETNEDPECEDLKIRRLEI